MPDRPGSPSEHESSQGPDPDAPSAKPEALPSVTKTPPRTFGVVTLVLAALLPTPIAAAVGYFVADRQHGSAERSSGVRYQCPMHPTIVQDRPGECPICGMKLVKMAGGSSLPTDRKIRYYRSPMNAAQTSPVPRKDEMGMDYVPVYEDEVGGSSSLVEGLATVDIPPDRRQLIGLRTADVTRGKVTGSWRTFSRVAVDERRVRHINVKVPVYVERVNVNFVGERVRRGQTLFAGYSPELLAAQAEYRVAIATQTALGASAPDATDAGIVKAARRRLELLDMPEAAIKRLEKGGEPQKTLSFTSPIDGVVVKKEVVDGMKLAEGAMPYEIVDLSTVWVLADIYEADLHRVRVGMPAKLTLKAYPNRLFEGVSAFVDPVLDPVTRTAKLRFSFPNPDGDLKPGMFGEVALEGAARDGLRIPEDAVIDSGTKKVVFVALGEGRLEPREVVLGESDRTHVEVVSGLAEGEKVVVRANFLVDSESRLRASLAALSTPTPQALPTVSPAALSTPTPQRSQALPIGDAGAGAHSHGRGESAPVVTSQPSPIVSATPAAQYACPMHPEVTDTTPSRCPTCGMVLTPVTPHGGMDGGRHP